jgi:nucleoside-diphosphate-sugar epimerase
MTDTFSLPEEDLEFIHETLGTLTNDLRGEILVTGASGFFGRWVVEAFVWMRQIHGIPINVHVLVRDATRYREEVSSAVSHGVQLISADIDTPISTYTNFSRIIHLASPLIRPNDPSAVHAHMRVAVRGMDQIIEMARNSEDCTVLFTSSGAVYGDYFGRTSKQNSREETFNVEVDNYLNEKLIYGQTKRFLELLLVTSGVKYGYNTRIARCFSFVGPYLPLDSNYAIGNFIRDALNNKSIIIHGDGKVRRSYMYAADLVVALFVILLGGRNGTAYNVGSAHSYSLLEVAHLVSAQTLGCKVEVLNRAVSEGAGAEYVPELELFKRDFGNLFVHPIEQAIAKTLRWYGERGNTSDLRHPN